jgi:hypothetical protein
MANMAMMDIFFIFIISFYLYFDLFMI